MRLEPTFSWNAQAHETSSEQRPRVLALLRSEEERPALTAALSGLEGLSIQLLLRTTPMVNSLLHSEAKPDVVLVDIDLTNDEDLAFVRNLKTVARVARVPIVALTERSSDLAALRAIRAGADDIILKPVDPAEANEIFKRVSGPHERAPLPDTKLGGTISFMHVSGGAGATTLAVNTATLLAEKIGTGEVCLLDLDIQYGNAANLLDLSAHSPIEGLIDDARRLDRDMLEGMMIKVSNKLRVLTAPRLPFPLGAYNSETVSRLIDIARRRFAHVVIDMPVALAPWSDIVLRECQYNYLVCEPTVTSAYRVSQLLKLLSLEELNSVPLKIVLNRWQQFGKGSDISPSQFAQAIGRPVDHVLTNDYALVSLSHNQGRPAAQLRPAAKLSRQISDMLVKDLRLNAAPEQRSWWPFRKE